MDFYHFNFAAFVLINSALAYYQTRCRQIPEAGSLEPKGNTAGAVKRFKMRFLPIYLLVNGADWLQVCFILDEFKCNLTDDIRVHTSTPSTKVCGIIRYACDVN